MEQQKHNFCIILAGGRGRRLWPSSRHALPKQCVDFFGTGRTQLQSTFDRMSRIIPTENIYICTCDDFLQIVREQLPTIPTEHIIIEPVNRNTAPSVAWAGRRIHRECSDARIIVIPTDQLVVNEEAFDADMLRGLEFVGNNDLVLTMGVRPSRPEPGYGYLQIGEASATAGINRVKSFTEKPERDFAQIFMDSGEFLWNTSIFLFNVGYLRTFIRSVFNQFGIHFSEMTANCSTEEEERLVIEQYPQFPNISIDKAALELWDNVYVTRCTFGWADLGTWHAIYECMSKQEGDNVVLDSEVILEDSQNNIVKLPRGHVGIINGLDGYIVAEEGDVLLICKKGDSSALIRKYVNEVGIRYGEHFI